jgi:hypothetical protein
VSGRSLTRSWRSRVVLMQAMCSNWTRPICLVRSEEEISKVTGGGPEFGQLQDWVPQLSRLMKRHERADR